MGTVRLMAGEREPAREDFEAALGLNPSVARAHSSLGLMAAESGRVDEALGHWRRRVAARPAGVREAPGPGRAAPGAGAGRPRPAPTSISSPRARPRPRYARDIERVRGLLSGRAPQG